MSVAQVWDPFDEAFIQDPWPAYRRLREEYPVYFNEERNFYALSRYDDVVEANRDWQTYSSAEGVDLDNTGSIFFGDGNIVESDPPSHDMLRSVLKDHLTPTFIRNQEEDVIRRVDGLVEELRDQRHVDFATAFATRLPLGVINDLLGVDPDNRDWVYQRFLDMFVRESGSEAIPESALQAAREVRGMLADELALRRKTPRGDLLTTISQGEIDGRPLTELEQVGMSTLVIAAGISTTKNLLTNIFWYLAQDPDLRAEVQAASAAPVNAIEEFLRYDGPIQNSTRVSTRDVELHGTHIPKGSRVTLVYGSANRDANRFDDPDRIDIGRRIGKHMAFGGGIHLCIGAPLARLEAKVVLQRALPSFGAFRLAGKPERTLKMNERGFETLPLEFDPA
ncbi:putative cytochrome P450 [Kaistia sp. 32K]|uniref:cytochrome P450 n=1 Tax=Kaistia sp. 32K TaxID=2795690 RepID=UPI0019162AA1|nr:cytochrome P450 [Kaistia sp. 32K]BCP53986.1 putative cytochrome P450 [Kaistia sp. 32K]